MSKIQEITLRRIISSILNNQRGSFMAGGASGGGEGGGGGGEGASGSAEGGGGNAAGGSGGSGITYNYPEGFDEKLVGNEGLLKFADDKGNFNYGNIMKSYVNSQSMIGKDKMGVPDDTYTEDQWSNYWNKGGRPEDVKEYGVKNNVGEGVEANEVFFKSFTEEAHKAGLSTKQAQAMSDFINTASSEGQRSINESTQAKIDSDSVKLKAEWGDAYDVNNSRAFTALEKFADEAMLGEIKQSGMLNNPLVAKLFNNVAKGLLEDTFDSKNKGSFGMDREAALEKRQSFYQPGHPFMVRGHSERQFYMDEMVKLNRIITASN